jgi:hypothetical protein
MCAFKTSLINLIAAPKGDSLNYRSAPNTQSKILHTSLKGKSGGRTTGDYFTLSDGTWLKVLLNQSELTAYVREDVTSLIKPTTNPTITDAEAQSLIDKLVKSDEETYYTLLRIAAILKQLSKAGIDISSYTAKYRPLELQFFERQQKMKDSQLLKIQIGIKKVYARLKETFGIGSITGLIVGAIIGVGVAVSIYFAFRPTYNESKVDLKVSSDLEKALSSLNPAAAASVKKDLEKQIDDAYNTGLKDGTFDGLFKILKPLGIGLFAFWGVTKLINSTRK